MGVPGPTTAAAGDVLLDEVRVSMRRHALTPVAREVQVTASALEERASCLGSIIMALDAVDLPA